MRFEIIMNMPVKKGDLVHRLIVEHPAQTLAEFVDELTEFDFVIVALLNLPLHAPDLVEEIGIVSPRLLKFALKQPIALLKSENLLLGDDDELRECFDGVLHCGN